MQNETTGALWTQESVNLLCAVYHTSNTEAFMYDTDYKGKDRFSTALLLESLCCNHILPDKDVAEEIIWSDGPSFEFKNQFVYLLAQKLSSNFMEKFSWKFSATSREKGVVDRVGGRVKSNIHAKVMSLGRD